jgi:hypothetical protein
MLEDNQRRLFAWLGIVAMYAITWAGGFADYAHELRAETTFHYELAQKRNTENAQDDLLFMNGARFVWQLHGDGPHWGVNWSVPILPGVLLLDSYSSIGPLYGSGSAKIVVYYGVGTVTICELWGWLA